MTAKDLKNALLQEAVQGKLVPQIASEGNAKDLLEEIRKEKAKLVKEGKIKKEKPLPEITEEEIPFDIPENWCWCRLGNLAEIKSSKRVFEKDYVNDGIPFFRSKEIGDLSRGELIHTELFISKKHYEELKKNYGVPKINDILLTSVGSIGNNWICDGRDFYYKDGNVTQICSNDFYDPNFLTSFLSSPLFFEQVNSSVSGTAYNALTIIKLKSLIFPLPPLAEQKRIVAAIEKFMPLIDEYGKKETELKALNEQIGTLTKKAILQEAVQGKLVPQIAAEGNAKDLLEEIRKEKAKLIKEGKIKKEKPLPEITEDEIPFDIPENWCWCRWGNLSYLIQYGYNASAQEKGKIRMLRISDIQDNKVLWESVPFCEIKDEDIPTYLLHKNDILFARTGGTVGKSFLVKELPCEAIYAGYLIRTHYDSKKLIPEYLKAFMESELYWSQLKEGTIATAQPNCNGQTLSKMIIPLPPLAEQKRIVAAIGKLSPSAKN